MVASVAGLPTVGAVASAAAEMPGAVVPISAGGHDGRKGQVSSDSCSPEKVGRRFSEVQAFLNSFPRALSLLPFGGTSAQ